MTEELLAVAAAEQEGELRGVIGGNRRPGVSAVGSRATDGCMRAPESVAEMRLECDCRRRLSPTQSGRFRMSRLGRALSTYRADSACMASRGSCSLRCASPHGDGELAGRRCRGAAAEPVPVMAGGLGWAGCGDRGRLPRPCAYTTRAGLGRRRNRCATRCRRGAPRSPGGGPRSARSG